MSIIRTIRAIYYSTSLAAMPYAVVETTNARGHKEVSAVPEKWIRKSKSANVMLWAVYKRLEQLEDMVRNENIPPKNNWLKHQCKIKRNGLRSYEEATNICEELSGASSCHARPTIKQRKKRINNNKPTSFDNMLVLDNAHPPPPPLISKLGPPVSLTQSTAEQPKAVQKQNLDNADPPRPLLIAKLDAPVSLAEPTVAPLQTQVVPMQPPVSSLQAPLATIDDYVSADQFVSQPADFVEPSGSSMYVTISEPCVLKDTTTQDLLRELIGAVNHRLDLLEKRTADIAIQNEFILDALRKTDYRTACIDELPELCFDPIEQEEQLAELEVHDLAPLTNFLFRLTNIV